MQQKNGYDCGVYACQFAYGMICLINTNEIKQSSRIKDIKRTFEKLCSRSQKGWLKRTTKEVYAKRNDSYYKMNQRRERLVILLDYLSQIHL